MTIAAGLGTGGIAALAILGAYVVLMPSASLPPEPTPTAPVETSAASPTAGSATPQSSATTTPSPSAPAAFHVGEPAPVLQVSQLGGGEIDLANLRGQPVWVNFWATTCPPCRDEFPLMSGFAARYSATGLVVVAVDVREDLEAVDAFVKATGAIFPIGLDQDGTAQLAWDAVALPVHFWIDRDGIIRAGALGGIGPDQMAEGLRTILPGVDVTP
jgi:thiol-disulfide isomerase/thioredoxin